jgi:hypothetical protein
VGPREHSSDDAWTPFALIPLVLALAGILWSTWWFWGFVQDDSYISLRYARHLAEGRGLVFNVGERVEGITNLSWTVLAAGLMKLGLDPLIPLRVLGACSALFLTWLVWFEAGGDAWRNQRRMATLAGFGALLLASSTSIGIWSVSCLEEVSFTLLNFAAYRQFARGRYLLAAYLYWLASITRPEAALAFGLAVLVRTAAHLTNLRRPSLDEIAALLLYGLGTATLLGFRLKYYGEPVPNTFYVKGVVNQWSRMHGWSEFLKYLDFNGMRWSLLLASLGLVGFLWTPVRDRTAVPTGSEPTGTRIGMFLCWLATMGALVGIGCAFPLTLYPNWLVQLSAACFLLLGAVSILAAFRLGSGPVTRSPRQEAGYGILFISLFLFYMIRVGGDLLPLFRLYIPVLPFVALWACRLLSWLSNIVVVAADGHSFQPQRWAGPVAAGAAAIGILTLAATNYVESFHHPEFQGSNLALQACHGRAGQIVEQDALAHPERTITVLLQDVGMTPWMAPHVRFVDVIGLVNQPIAKTLYAYGYTPYIRYLLWQDTPAREQVLWMEQKTRGYLLTQKGDWVLVNVNCAYHEVSSSRDALRRLDEAYFFPKLAENVFYYDLFHTPDFQLNYHLVHGFEFSQVHYLLMYKRTEKPRATPMLPNFKPVATPSYM